MEFRIVYYNPNDPDWLRFCYSDVFSNIEDARAEADRRLNEDGRFIYQVLCMDAYRMERAVLAYFGKEGKPVVEV